MKRENELIWEAYAKEEKFDAKELKMGIKVELEHGMDKPQAEKIAKDHLRENPTYYSDLKKCQSKIKKKL